MCRQASYPKEHPSQDTILVTHLGVLYLCLQQALGIPAASQDKKLYNGILQRNVPQEERAPGFAGIAALAQPAREGSPDAPRTWQ